MRGEVIEVDPKGKWIKTKGEWNSEEEVKKWIDVEKVEYSTDYPRYHQVRDNVDVMLVQPRNMLTNDTSLSRNGSWGLYHPSVDDSCRDAFDLIQVIRHEFWKRDPNGSSITVNSSIALTDEKNKNIKVEL